MLTVQNHGPLIVSTDYWQSEAARAGKLLVSVNAGAIRCLLPESMWSCIPDLRESRYAVLSRGPWPDAQLADAVEILWEDDTDAPIAWHLSPESFSLLPAEPPAGREWIISAWVERDGRPHRALERPCHWRRVARIPCLEPWKETSDPRMLPIRATGSICCERMADAQDQKYPREWVIARNPESGSWQVMFEDFVEGPVGMRFCPWCGKPLPTEPAL